MSFSLIPVFATTSLSADGGNLTTQLIYAALASIAIGVAVMVGEGFFQRKAIITMLHAGAASLGAFAIIAGVLTWYNGTAAPVQAAVASTWGSLPGAGGAPTSLTFDELDKLEAQAALQDVAAAAHLKS
jgi:hypothetical protein